MKNFYSKSILPRMLHKSQLKDLKSYQLGILKRAKKYAKLADIEVKQCYICGNKTFSLFMDVYGFSYTQCKNCTHIILNRRLSKKDLTLFYKENSQYASTYTDKDSMMYRLENIAKPKVSFVMKNIQNQDKGLWLDIGCAIGDVAKAVEMYKGWKATGIDISNDSVKVGKEVFRVDLQPLQFKEFVHKCPNLKFDVVSAFGYFGLIPDPLEEINLAVSIIRKGGYLVIGDSNGESMTSLLQQSYPELTCRHLLPPNSLHGFTSKSLFEVLKRIKFKPIALWNFGLDFVEWLKYCALIDGKFQESPIYNFLLNNSNEFQKVIDKKKMGDYMIVIAQKT